LVGFPACIGGTDISLWVGDDLLFIFGENALYPLKIDSFLKNNNNLNPNVLKFAI
jgi:hypothetical protein